MVMFNKAVIIFVVVWLVILEIWIWNFEMKYADLEKRVVILEGK